MKLSDLFRFSTDNLRRRKGRTILTIIGVVVGVCAIVVMISLGIAVNRATDEMLQTWGDLTKITVISYGAQQGTPDLDDAMVEQFKTIPNVTAATPMFTPYDINGSVLAGKNGRYEGYTSIVGMDVAALQPMGYKLLTGEYMEEGQPAGRDKIHVLLGQQIVFSFQDTKRNPNSANAHIWPEYDENYMEITNLPQYDEAGNMLNEEQFFFDPMKEKLIYRMYYGYDENTQEQLYKEYELVVAGIIEAGISDYEIASSVIMSMADVQKLQAEYKKLTKSSGSSGGFGGGMAMGGMVMGGMGDDGTVQVGGYENVYVKANDVKNMPNVEQYIKEMGYQMYSMSQERDRLQGQVAQTQMMLGGLAAISLFVAALNIANTMTMAIYERTKEIGVMKVLGCNLGNIRQMFLIESGFIGLLGGVLGVLLSLLISLALNYLPTLLMMLGVEGNVDFAGLFGLSGLSESMPGMQMSVIPLWLILLALGFATVVGLLSGIAPANRAVKISSLEAIRHE